MEERRTIPWFFSLIGIQIFLGLLVLALWFIRLQKKGNNIAERKLIKDEPQSTTWFSKILRKWQVIIERSETKDKLPDPIFFDPEALCHLGEEYLKAKMNYDRVC